MALEKRVKRDFNNVHNDIRQNNLKFSSYINALKAVKTLQKIEKIYFQRFAQLLLLLLCDIIKHNCI